MNTHINKANALTLPFIEICIYWILFNGNVIQHAIYLLFITKKQISFSDVQKRYLRMKILLVIFYINMLIINSVLLHGFFE